MKFILDANKESYKVIQMPATTLESDGDLVSRRLRDSLQRQTEETRPRAGTRLSCEPLTTSPKTRTSAKRMKYESNTHIKHLIANDVNVIILDDSSSSSSNSSSDDSTRSSSCDSSGLGDAASAMDVEQDDDQTNEPMCGLEDDGRVKGGGEDTIACDDDELVAHYERKLGVRLKCYVKLDRIDVEKLKASLKQATFQIKSSPVLRSIARKLSQPKRLRSKSKTFPIIPQPITSETSHLSMSSSQPVAPGVVFLDMDAITVVSSQVSNGLGELSTSTRSTRSSTSNKRVNYDETVMMNAACGQEQISKTPPVRSPGPGELLRRKSNSMPLSPGAANGPGSPASALSANAAASATSMTVTNGSPTVVRGEYTCEMDKLFRGDLVTVTQCLTCETKREKHEEFYDRSIPVDDTVADQQEVSIFYYYSLFWKCISFNSLYILSPNPILCLP